MNLLQEMERDKLIIPPYWLADNIMFLVEAGSISYGTNTPDSDHDIRGVTFPSRHILFPWETGVIPGFGTQPPKFESWLQHHVDYKDKQYDMEVYSIIKYFELLRLGNPNIIDTLFVPENCVIHITQAGIHMRKHRRKFLSKASISKFLGFAWNHMRNMKNPKKTGKRQDLVQKFGYDTKDAGHVYRTAAGLEDMLLSEDYDIQKHREAVKAIRAGQWTYEQLNDWFTKKLVSIDEAKAKSKLPEEADELELRKILLECLEIHYGRLDKVIVDDNRAKNMLRKIENILREGTGAF